MIDPDEAFRYRNLCKKAIKVTLLMASAICPGGCFVTFDRARCYVAIFVLDNIIMNEQQDEPHKFGGVQFC